MAFSSCHRVVFNAEQQQTAKVAQGYLDAMANFDPQAAMPYASEETRRYTIPLFTDIIAQLDTNYVQSQIPATIAIDSINIHASDTTATVFFTKTMPLQTKHQQLDMVKRHGKWQAHVPTQVPAALQSHRSLANQDFHDIKVKKMERVKK